MPLIMPSSEIMHDHEMSPPSTRPSSAASTCTSGGPPNRTTSMDSLYTSSSSTSADKSTLLGQEYIPTRVTRTTPKINTQAMQFVKVGPAELYKSATEQLKKSEHVKQLRKQMITEEEDWQQPTSTPSSRIKDDAEDWQSNLDKWKSSRRKRNEEALERVIEVKKNEQDEEFQKRRRKSRTFSEMVDDKNKRGRRFNLVVHDDDNNDLGDLGLTSGGNSTVNEIAKTDSTPPPKDVYNDIKDTKSDAGFCTGSDTGSDGVFAEDNISDTSSALGDKKEAHDSLLDCGIITKEDDAQSNGNESIIASTSPSCVSPISPIPTNNTAPSKTDYGEYTYDKAIQNYKQFAESTTKKRTTSISSLTSVTSTSNEVKSTTSSRSSSPTKGQRIGDKLNFFNREIEKEFTKPVVEAPKCIRREKSPKVDITKRRSMFELREPVVEVTETRKSSVQYSSTKSLYQPRKNSDTTIGSLKSKVASFENLDSDSNKYKGVTPPRDSKFKEKLANFTQKESSLDSQHTRKKTPERDQTFHQKLASFSSLEKGQVNRVVENKTKPMRDFSLKNKIASFEQLDQLDEKESISYSEESFYRKDKAVSMDCLNKTKNEVNFQSSVSMGNLLRRVPSTPYMIVDLNEDLAKEKPFVCSERSLVSGFSNVSLDQLENRSSVHETVEVKEIVRDVESAPIYSIFNYLKPEVNSEAFNKALQLEDTTFTENEEYSHNHSHKTEKHSVNSSHTVSSLSHTSTEKSYQNVSSTIEQSYATESSNGYQSVRDTTENSYEEADKKLYSNGDSNEGNEYYDEIDPPNSVPNHTNGLENGANEENIYENIIEDHLYENIYEKVNEDNSTYSSNHENDHFYQTLDDAQEEKKIVASQAETQEVPFFVASSSGNSIGKSSDSFISSPPQPPPPVISQVTDVTWTEDHLRAVAPPSEPPPPPPPDEDDGSSTDEGEDGVYRHQAQNSQSSNDGDQSTSHIKKELQKRRSAFLGTSPVIVDEEPTIKPPPDLSELLREECEAERKLKEKFNFLSNDNQSLLDEKEVLRREKEIIESLEREEEQRRRYNWEDRQQEKEEDSSDIQELLHYNNALAQLEMEMVQHDQEMLQRTGQIHNIQTPPPHETSMHSRTSSTNDSLPTPKTSSDVTPSYSPRDAPQSQLQKPIPQPQSGPSLPLQEFYRAPIYKDGPPNQEIPPPIPSIEPPLLYHHNPPPPKANVSKGSPSHYASLASPHPFVHSHSASSIASSASSTYSSNSPREGITPEPLPRKKRAPPPVPEKSLDTAERIDAIRQSKHPGTGMQDNIGMHPHIEQEPIIDGTSGQNMSKQTLKALSAIPKPRLNDNDSWITKKKNETKTHYSKHWLIQEAEQRRIEQHQRQERSSKLSSQLQQSSLPPIPQQLIPTEHSNPTYQATSAMGSMQHHANYSEMTSNDTNQSYNQGLSYSSSSTSTMSYSNSSTNINNMINNNSNSIRRDQATTYQPRLPPQNNSNDKPLPDCIINSLTQRVNNKNKGAIPNGKHYNNNYHNDENYHDYMNADSLVTTMQGGNQSGGFHPNTSPSINMNPTNQSLEDQKLLSVSGKKKCSHCGDELGRGAAMIIESLRLFYHIPCFKCCVCGIQLGNGTAGADVRVRNHKLHCHNCYSNDEGMKFSKV